MTKMNFDLPDDLAATLEAMPEDERNHFAAAAFMDALDEMPETQEELATLAGPLTPEDIAALGRSLADGDAGRVVDAKTVFANLRQRVGLPVK